MLSQPLPKQVVSLTLGRALLLPSVSLVTENVDFLHCKELIEFVWHVPEPQAMGVVDIR